jgi:hypothetical protein
LILCYGSGTSCSLPAGLAAIGLSDIRKVVRLMSLTAGRRVELSSDLQQPLVEGGPRPGAGASSLQLGHLTSHLPPPTATCLNYLSCAIAALAQTDTEASELVLQMCTKVKNRNLLPNEMQMLFLYSCIPLCFVKQCYY